MTAETTTKKGLILAQNHPLSFPAMLQVIACDTSLAAKRVDENGDDTLWDQTLLFRNTSKTPGLTTLELCTEYFEGTDSRRAILSPADILISWWRIVNKREDI